MENTTNNNDNTINIEITGTCDGNPKTVKWNLVKQVNGEFCINGFYYGSGTRWGGLNPTTGKASTLELSLSKPVGDGQGQDYFQYDSPIYYDVSIKINNSDIMQISEEEVRSQLHPPSPPVEYDEDGEVIPSLPSPPNPNVTIETEKWIVRLATRDLHRWPNHPIEISGCSVVDKSTVPVYEPSPPLPSGWRVYNIGRREYFCHTATGTVQWEQPGNVTPVRKTLHRSWSESDVIKTPPSNMGGGAATTTDHVYVAKFDKGKTRGAWHALPNTGCIAYEVHERGMVKIDWKCHLCRYNNGKTTTMFKIVGEKKFKLCCHQCIDMVPVLFCSETFEVLREYVLAHKYNKF